MARIFISYSHSYTHITVELAKQLRRVYGYDDVWFDEVLYGGQDWWEEILNQIADCKVFLFLISPETLESEYCQKELSKAIHLRKTIIPILVHALDMAEIPQNLRRLQIIDMSSGIDTDGFAELEAGISHTGTTKNRSAKKYRFFVVPILAVFIGLSIVLIRIRQSSSSDIKLAYEFLVDTSDNMLQPLNGISRYQIVNEAIEQIISVPGLGTSQVWRGVRIAGGDESCKQTSLPVHGIGLSINDFMSPLKSLSPKGDNAYQAGLDETFEDMNLPEVKATNSKVIFIFLGSLDPSPCPHFYLPEALAAYKQFGIATTFCTFTLVDDLPGFDDFRKAMEENGFGCVHNVDKPEEINQIAVSVLLQELRHKVGQEEPLTPVASPIGEVILKATETPIASPLPSPGSNLVTNEIAANTATPTENLDSAHPPQITQTPIAEGEQSGIQQSGTSQNLQTLFTATLTSTSTPTQTATLNLKATYTARAALRGFRVYDDFSPDNSPGKFDTHLWRAMGFNEHIAISHDDGAVTFTGTSISGSVDFVLGMISPESWQIGDIGRFQADVKVNSSPQSGFSFIKIQILSQLDDGDGDWWTQCRLGGISSAYVICDAYRHLNGEFTSLYQSDTLPLEFDKFYKIAILMSSDGSKIQYFVDDRQIGEYIPDIQPALRKGNFSPRVGMYFEDQSSGSGSIDNVWIGSS